MPVEEASRLTQRNWEGSRGAQDDQEAITGLSLELRGHPPQIEHVALRRIGIATRQLKKHPKAYIAKLAAGISRYGFLAHLLKVTAITGELDRLVINLPPRSAKSTLVSVALPAFLLGIDPTRRIIVVSYNQDLAAQFSRQTRQVMQSQWYRALFPSTSIPTRAAENEFFTSAGGFRMATSTGGTFTGRGGDLIIIDDPLKAEDAYSETARLAAFDWATRTLFTRLDDKANGAIILVQQRQHEDDLSGHMLRTGEWYELSLPAIVEKDETFVLFRDPLRFHHRRVGDLLDPVREPEHILAGLKRQMGSAAFSAQYQQAPLPPDGDVVRLSWFKTFDDLPDGGEVIFSVDTASKAGLRNDWSVVEV